MTPAERENHRGGGRRGPLWKVSVSIFLWLGSAAASGEESAVVIEEEAGGSPGVAVHRVTSPYQAGVTRIRLLAPAGRPPRAGFPVVYLLPVEAGDGNRWGDGLSAALEARLHERHGIVCVAPTFSHLPWYADHPQDPEIRQETYFLRVVVPFIEKTYPVRKDRDGRWLVGFSKSGWGAFSLLLRHPDLFGRAAAWDAPLALQRPDRYGMEEIFGTQGNFERYRITALVEERRDHLRSRARLALLGYDNFREHHRKLHEQLKRLQIPHEYRDGPRRKHHWESGWLLEAVAWAAKSLPK